MALMQLRTSRRTVLKGAAVGAGAAALASCSAGSYGGRGVLSRRVSEVPLDPTDATWADTEYTDVVLGPQNAALPQRLDPAVTAVRVRSVHDGRQVGFRLEWTDEKPRDQTIRVDDYRDACAVLLGPGDADANLRMMGTAEIPVTLLHWKADWQRMLADGDEGLDAAFPNRTVDTYPVVHRVPPEEVGIESYVEADATEWLPAIHVGNPVAGRAVRTTSVEKAIAAGFSTTTSAGDQDATGRGERTDEGWQVVIVKPLTPTEEGEIDLAPGTVSTCAFAVWSGSDRDAGSRKCPATEVAALELEE